MKTKNEKLNKNSHGAERKNNSIKILAGALMMVLLIEGVSATDQGLAAYWSFDGGTANDEAGNNDGAMHF